MITADQVLLVRSRRSSNSIVLEPNRKSHVYREGWECPIHLTATPLTLPSDWEPLFTVILHPRGHDISGRIVRLLDGASSPKAPARLFVGVNEPGERPP